MIRLSSRREKVQDTLHLFSFGLEALAAWHGEQG